MKHNPHSGSDFDDFLKEEDIFEEVQAKALKRAIAEQLKDSMDAAHLNKVAMATKMDTSRSQLDRVLDPDNTSIQLDTLIKAARAVGGIVEISIKKGGHIKRDSAGRFLTSDRNKDGKRKKEDKKYG